MQKGLVIILSGPSGVGKTTVATSLIRDESLAIHRSISATTRSRRTGEVDGQDYDFLSPEDFNKKVKSNDFLEYAEVHGNYYGTQLSRVNERIQKGQNVILVIDVQGAEQVRKRLPNVLSIFLRPRTMEDLAIRLKRRDTDSPEIIQGRLEEASREMDRMNEYDHVVISDQLDESVEQIRKIIAARLKEK